MMSKQRLDQIGALICFGLSVAIGFVAQIGLLNTLDPATYGEFATIYAAMAVLAAIGAIGFDTAALRFSPALQMQQDKSGISYFHYVSLAAILSISIPITIGAGVFASLLYDLSAAALALFGLALLGWSLVRYYSAAARTLGHFAISIIADRLLRDGFLLVAAGIAFLGAFTLGMVHLAAALFLAAIVAIALCAPDFARKFPPRRWSIAGQAKIWFVASIGLAGLNMVEMFMTRQEVFIASWLMGANHAGTVNAVMILTSIVIIPITAATVLVFPDISRHYHSGDKASAKRLLFLFTIFNFFSAVIVCAVTLLLFDYIKLVFPTHGNVSDDFIKIVLVLRTFLVLFSGTSPLMMMSGDHRKLIAIYVVVIFIKFGLAVIFVPAYGIEAIFAITIAGGFMLTFAQITLAVLVFRRAWPTSQSYQDAARID